MGSAPAFASVGEAMEVARAALGYLAAADAAALSAETQAQCLRGLERTRSASTRSPAPAPARPPGGSARRPARGTDIRSQGPAQRIGVPGAQVDLVLGAIQPEPDRALGLPAIEVIDQQGLHPLRHVYATPLGPIDAPA